MAKKKFDEIIKEDLQKDSFATAYLNDALEEGGVEEFLLAVRRVIQARMGFSSMAEECAISREHLYTMFSDNGNPTIYNLYEVLNNVGLKLSIAPAHNNKKVA